MCGLVTIVTAPGQSISFAVLRRMTETLAHRGPDDAGYAWVDPATGTCRALPSDHPGEDQLSGILFGHRRLSILDLTHSGHQPMLSDDVSMMLSFNGEIYNFLELRAELESKQVAFRSRCDTEVLLRAYQMWGARALEKFNGMWAFTLWDGHNRRLVVSRDRFGVKPLYYSVVDGAWVFASEIKALLAYPGGFRGFDDQQVLEFLANCLIDHGQGTFFRNIYALMPGTYAELADQRLTQYAFWSLPPAPARASQTAPQLVEQFRNLLSEAVRLRVRADVPIGTMLSGGLDSTSITALIHQQRLGMGGDTPAELAGLQAFHHTFSACWPGWQRDEEAEVDMLCADLDLQPHKLYPTAEEIAELLPQAMYFLDQPFETPTAVVQFMLMRLARTYDIKVVLNGHGSDELLGGYLNYFVPPFLASLIIACHPASFLRQQRAFRASGGWTHSAVAMELARGLLPVALRPHADELLYSPARWRKSLGIFPDTGIPAGIGHPVSDVPAHNLSLLNAALWQKFTQQILPMWLRMEDRVSMAWSIESRLPFLDYRLVEFAFNLPDELKLNEGYTKYILRSAMRGKLPDRITFNRVKQRFATPYHEWFRGAWRPMIEDLLLGTCNVQPYVELPKLRRKLGAYLAGDNRALDVRVLWRVLSTEICLRGFSTGANRL
jgi:asparagine synthase (glutamine-hydrolysing)